MWGLPSFSGWLEARSSPCPARCSRLCMPLEPVLAIVVIAGALIAGRRSSCECVCHNQVDAQIVEILREQLSRCGPEHLGPSHLSGGGAVTFFTGVAFGILISGAVALLVALFLTKRAATSDHTPDRPTPSLPAVRPLEGRRGIALTAAVA